MKLITLEKVLHSLKKLEPRVIVPEGIRTKSIKALNLMIGIG
jgi:quinolinate synthase